MFRVFFPEFSQTLSKVMMEAVKVSSAVIFDVHLCKNAASIKQKRRCIAPLSRKWNAAPVLDRVKTKKSSQELQESPKLFKVGILI